MEVDSGREGQRNLIEDIKLVTDSGDWPRFVAISFSKLDSP